MTFTQQAAILRELNCPQIVVATIANVNTCSMSQHLRGLIELSELQREHISDIVAAIREVDDASPVPIDWKRGLLLRAEIESKVERFRRERVTELRRKAQSASELTDEVLTLPNCSDMNERAGADKRNDS